MEIRTTYNYCLLCDYFDVASAFVSSDLLLSSSSPLPVLASLGQQQQQLLLLLLPPPACVVVLLLLQRLVVAELESIQIMEHVQLCCWRVC